MMIAKINAVWHTLKATRSKKRKAEILDAHREVAGLKDFFKLCLCPSLNYHHTKLPSSTSWPDSRLLTDQQVIDYLYTCGRAKKPSDCRQLLEMMGRNCTPGQLWFIERVLKRKPDCGVDTTANAIWPGLIRTQIYQGAVADNPERIKKLHRTRESVLYEVKEDGAHQITETWLDAGDGQGDGAHISLRSRQGEDMAQHPEFERHLRLLLGAQFDTTEYYIAGEGLIKDDGPTSIRGVLPRAEGNALINQGALTGWRYSIFDVLRRPEVLGTQPCRTVAVRRFDLQMRMELYLSKCVLEGIEPLFSISEGEFIGSYNDGKAWVEAHIAAGAEGAVVKDPSHKFKNGKPAALVKWTLALDLDAVCTGWTPHRQRPHEVGALMFEVPSGKHNGVIRFKAGSGLTQMQREHPRPDDYIGCLFTCTVKDISRAKGKKAVTSVANPRIAELRMDIDHADTADTVFARYESRTGRRHPLDVRPNS